MRTFWTWSVFLMAGPLSAQESTVDVLIQKLGHDEIFVRDRATERLFELGYPYLDQYKKAAATSTDVEIQDRLASLIRRIQSVIIVKNLFVNFETGRVLGKVPGVPHYATSSPDSLRSDCYHVGGKLVHAPSQRMVDPKNAPPFKKARSNEGGVRVTGSVIVRVDSTKKEVWKTAWTDPRDYYDGLQVVPMTDGTLLAVRFMRMADAGADLLRLNSNTGKVLWRAHCSGLGVEHSKYRHFVYAKVTGGTVLVISQGSAGSFVEVLSVDTGESIHRWKY